MSKFLPLAAYEEPLSKGYRLLPFRFTRLSGDDYVATNFAGEFTVLNRADLELFSGGSLSYTSPVYEELKSKHFLLDSDSDVPVDLLALKLRTKLAPLSGFTGLHMFVATLRCEHSCPYCQVSRANDDRTEFDMSRETASRALALVFRSPNPAVKIEFQGGEPLLNFPIIQYVVEEAVRLNATHRRNLAFVIATNLAVIDDEILQFCRRHDILISTSLDGPRDLHNKNRPRPGGNSYEKTIEGIRMARDALGRDRVGALMTTTLGSLGRAREIVDEYVAQGFDGVFLRPLSPYGFALKTKSFKAYDENRWLEFYFEGLDYIIELNLAGLWFAEQYAALILRKMLTPFQPGYVDLMSPSGIGIGAVSYNYDGDVYASDESRMLAEMGDKTFCIGNVHRDTFEDIFLSEKLLGPLEASFSGSAPMCSWCAFEPYCGSDPVFHYATQGDFLGKKPLSAFCNRNLAIFRGLISRMRERPEVQQIFERWANVG